jgi:HlyD family type I secretion membrane fusion protein
VVKVASERKTVQHLEGGLIKEIRVKEDQEVTAGQVLLTLDDTTARARLGLLRGQYDALASQMARLEAERDGRGRMVLPPDLLNRRTDPQVAALINGEEALFNSRRDAQQSQINLLRQRNQQYDETISGLNAQMTAAKTKIGYIREEIKAAESLLEQGMYTKPRYYSLQREAASLDGEIGRLRSDIAGARERISETDMRVITLKQEAQKEANDRLQMVRTQMNDAVERLSAANDIMARTQIVAPQSGKVIGLQVHTVGGVIKDGATILEIVPKNDKLIVEAHVRTDDIDVVHKGLPAEVRFTALNLRTTPVFKGTVTRVSADRFTDPQRGDAYYTAQVEVDPKNLTGLSLYPGMAAEVYIVTGQRTPLEYLLKPFMDQMQRGLLEQ